MSNYPDDIRSYDNDPRSPFYVDPPEDEEETVTLPDGVLKRIQPMKKKATIVEAVTTCVKFGNDAFWAVEYMLNNDTEASKAFVLDHSALENSTQQDENLIALLQANPGSAKLYAIEWLRWEGEIHEYPQ